MLKGELSSSFKIGITPTVAPYILPKFIGDFTKDLPLIHFSISELTTDSIITKLNKREIDVGILALPLGEDNLLEYHLYNEEFVLFDCCSSHNKDIIDLEISEMAYPLFKKQSLFLSSYIFLDLQSEN